MTPIPAVSVIVPFYNRSFCVERIYESLCRQTLSRLEFLFVDDGSIDDTGDKLKDIAANDSRVTYLHQQNAGAGSARNAGLKAARGKYVAFLDSDDAFGSNDSLQILYDAAQTHGVNIAGGSLVYEKRGKAIASPNSWQPSLDEIPPAPHYPLTSEENEYLRFSEDGVFEYKDYQFDAGFTRFLYRRDLLVDNDIYFPARTMYEDPVFFVRAMSAAKKFYATKQTTYIWKIGWHAVKLTVDDFMAKAAGIEENLVLSANQGFGLLHWITAAYRLMLQDNMDLRLLLLGEDVQNRFLEVVDRIDLHLVEAYGDLPNAHLISLAKDHVSIDDLPLKQRAIMYKRLARLKMVKTVKSSDFFQKRFLRE